MIGTKSETIYEGARITLNDWFVQGNASIAHLF